LPDAAAANVPIYTKSEKRIAQLTLILGLLAAFPFAHYHAWRWGIGILVGAILSWFNFRWLRQGMDALTEASVAQASQQKAYVPLGTYFAAVFRYGLIGLAVYVIFRYLNVPVLSMVLGLCALGAATLVVSVHEILHQTE
jgi:small-conductance mechanosensitive channel